MRKFFLALVLFLIFNAVFNALPIYGQAPETLQQAIYRVAVANKIPPRLFGELVTQESSLKIRAYSPKGAACLTQLMPGTARRFGLRVDAQVDERFNVEKCLQAGAQYFAWLIRTFNGDVRLALAGYNAGEGAVFKFGNKIPPYRETTQYVERICYRTYGQAGHAMAMAYDRNRAYQWTAGLYVRRTVSVRNSPAPVFNSPINSQPLENPVLPATIAATEQTPETVQSIQKPKITRVANEAVQPKLRTESLYFWKQSNEEK